jgi:hypothetical protein
MGKTGEAEWKILYMEPQIQMIKNYHGRVPLAHASNPNFLGSWDQEDGDETSSGK